MLNFSKKSLLEPIVVIIVCSKIVKTDLACQQMVICFNIINGLAEDYIKKIGIGIRNGVESISYKNP